MTTAGAPTRTPDPADLRGRLAGLAIRDERRLRRRLNTARDAAALQRLAHEIDQAQQRIEGRRAAVPELRYPEELPVSQRREDLLAAIRDHQVVVVAGETGSGKTTQLPKICLELGRGVRGMIGHTQPRRLAARTVAERIAEELAVPLGEAVGYQVRFTDRVGGNTLVKLMTDGILLTEIQRDRDLLGYDTLVIDEAHERSLNIDFILGYVNQLLPRRPDLKVVITSATIDPERFAAHFGGAPIVEVSGRTYPVEVRYRPLEGEPAGQDGPDEPRDEVDGICDAVRELRTEPAGDILVFLSGEREIRDTADALGKLDLPGTEILPLYARLSAVEQHRVFQPHSGRRIVLATNVAETSLTVPGIKYVIDPGTARISRYSFRTKVQRLPIEAISQASANQRKGRCGRTSDGICVRLYSEADFEARPQFTDPEILRTNLASVILQMTALGLGDVAAFPFLDPPDARHITDGVRLLHELGALEPARSPAGPGAADRAGDGRGGPAQGPNRLTPLGRRLAQLPIDPRIGRMVLEAERLGRVAEVLVIAAGLSIQDPRERPAELQQAADTAHARFADPESDFLAYLNLWRYLGEQQRELSSSRFRKLCRTEFLNYLRVREWQDLHGQLRQIVKGLGMHPGPLPEETTDPAAVHQALLAGLLSHIGLKDVEKNEYLGARNAKFAVWPGSALFKKTPRWVMAAELVETSRLWARIAAKIEPEWAEQLAGHLVKRQYSEPHWERRRGSVVASEKVTLYGVPLVADRKVDYGRIDPVLSRELFIRHALVEGDWQTHHRFFHDNRALLAEVEELEHRVRRRDILVDDETVYAFYDQRIPADVVSARHFDAWWKSTRKAQPDLLSFDRSMLVNTATAGVAADDYPEVWTTETPGASAPTPLRLAYQFEPGAAADGVTVEIPLPILSELDPEQFRWQVPGLRLELVTALIRSLPKALRRNFVPVPDFARAALERVDPDDAALLEGVERALRELTGIRVPREAWQPDKLPDHLRVTFRVLGEDGRTLAEGKDLPALQRRLRPAVHEVVAAAAAEDVERHGLRDWDGLGELPRSVVRQRGGHRVTAYPALHDEGGAVGVRVFATAAEQARAMWQGTRRLLLLNAPNPLRGVPGLPSEVKLALSRNPHGAVPKLLDDCVTCALDKIVTERGGPAWDEAAFAALLEGVRGQLADTALDTVRKVARVLTAAYRVEQRLRATTDLALVPALTDMRDQLRQLVYPGFVTATGWWRLADLPRYLEAIEHRLVRLPQDPQRDLARMRVVQQVHQEYADLRAHPPAGSAAALHEIRWMIEELRVSQFAQSLGTPYPISDKRIYRAIDEASA